MTEKEAYGLLIDGDIDNELITTILYYGWRINHRYLTHLEERIDKLESQLKKLS